VDRLLFENHERQQKRRKNCPFSAPRRSKFSVNLLTVSNPHKPYDQFRLCEGVDYGGLKGPEIGLLFGVEYSAVSQERKRLREQISENQNLREIMGGLEKSLSIIKTPLFPFP
jgi:hypothetical protein